MWKCVVSPCIGSWRPRAGRCTALLFLQRQRLDGGMGGQQHTPAASLPGKTRYPLNSRLGVPQGRSERVRKISRLPGFDSWIVHSVASRYTDWAISAASSCERTRILSDINQNFKMTAHFIEDTKCQCNNNPLSEYRAVRCGQKVGRKKRRPSLGACRILIFAAVWRSYVELGCTVQQSVLSALK